MTVTSLCITLGRALDCPNQCGILEIWEFPLEIRNGLGPFGPGHLSGPSPAMATRLASARGLWPCQRLRMAQLDLNLNVDHTIFR